ncbi:hypothetical protein [Streptomyces sp. URMC 123]|uniref:hypothetical protein n=1 Tax=Streptomyces sp. URMC 123 TaxID=3423403 RepID=UPI003F1DE06C
MRSARRTGLFVVGIAAAAALVVGCSVEKEVQKEFDRLDNKEYEVEYEVTGSGVIDLTYGVGNQGELSSETVKNPTLPWRKKLTMKGIVTVPDVSVLLGENGGQADCVIRVNGKETKRATAKGEFGVASCVATSPIAESP